MSEQLTCLIYELLDAHDDTARIAPSSVLDATWAAHLDYLRSLQRVVGRELLAAAAKDLDAEAARSRLDN